MKDDNVFYGWGRKAATRILNRLKFRKDAINKNEHLTIKNKICIYEIETNEQLTEENFKDLEKKGKLKLIIDSKNIITNSGLNWECDRFHSNSLDPMGYIAVGEDATTQTVNDTALGNELLRVVATITDTSNRTTTSAYFPPGVATGNWKESGILNAASNGILYNRVVFDYVKGASVGTYVVFTHTRENA